MAPIRKGDGAPLEIPGVQEVRSGDGRVFFDDAIPDSAIYWEGQLEDDWEVSYTEGNYTAEKRDESLFMQVGDESTSSYATFATISTEDLTDVDNVEVRSSGNSQDDAAEFYISVEPEDTEQRIQDFDTAELVRENETWDEETDTLDVSGLSGDYYVGVGLRDGSTDSSRDIEVDVERVELI